MLLANSAHPIINKQLAYAARFKHSALLYGRTLDTVAAHAAIERAAGCRVELCDQRTVIDPALVATKLATADRLHIAVDWIMTPELADTLAQALTGPNARRLFVIVSSCVTLPADLGVDLRQVLSSFIAWNEVL